MKESFQQAVEWIYTGAIVLHHCFHRHFTNFISNVVLDVQCAKGQNEPNITQVSEFGSPPIYVCFMLRSRISWVRISDIHHPAWERLSAGCEPIAICRFKHSTVTPTSVEKNIVFLWYQTKKNQQGLWSKIGPSGNLVSKIGPTRIIMQRQA